MRAHEDMAATLRVIDLDNDQNVDRLRKIAATAKGSPTK